MPVGDMGIGDRFKPLIQDASAFEGVVLASWRLGLLHQGDVLLEEAMTADAKRSSGFQPTKSPAKHRLRNSARSCLV